MVALPRGDAERAAGDREVVVGEGGEELAERDRVGALGRGLAVAERVREARRAGELAEEERGAGHRADRDARLAAGLVHDAQRLAGEDVEPALGRARGDSRGKRHTLAYHGTKRPWI